MEIIVNNQKLSVEDGTTVLEAALANGIDIPHLNGEEEDLPVDLGEE